MKQILETVEKPQTATEFLESKGLKASLYFVAQKNSKQEYVMVKPDEVVKSGSELRAIPKVAGG